MRRLFVTVISLFPLASLAAAPLQQQIADCAAILDAQSRLSCYDKVAAQLRVSGSATTIGSSENAPSTTTNAASAAAATSANAQLTASPAASATVSAAPVDPEAEFGMEHKKKLEDVPDRIDVKIVSKKKDPYGRWKVTLENGQVWKQTDSRKFRFSNEEGKAYIKRGALGSFFLGEEEHSRGMKVKRVK